MPTSPACCANETVLTVIYKNKMLRTVFGTRKRSVSGTPSAGTRVSTSEALSLADKGSGNDRNVCLAGRCGHRTCRPPVWPKDGQY